MFTIGFTSLTKNNCGSKIYASSFDNSVYEFESAFLRKTKRYTAEDYSVESFYIKTALSPCETMLISASSDGGVYMWEVDAPRNSPLKLSGHTQETTAVAWSAYSPDCIATCSDEMNVRFWVKSMLIVECRQKL